MSQERQSEYGSTKEVAARFGLKEQTWRKYRLHGGGPPFVKLSLGQSKRGRVLYRFADIEAWLAARTFTSTAAVEQRVTAQAENVPTPTPEAAGDTKSNSLPTLRRIFP